MGNKDFAFGVAVGALGGLAAAAIAFGIWSGAGESPSPERTAAAAAAVVDSEFLDRWEERLGEREERLREREERLEDRRERLWEIGGKSKDDAEGYDGKEPPPAEEAAPAPVPRAECPVVWERFVASLRGAPAEGFDDASLLRLADAASSAIGCQPEGLGATPVSPHLF